MTFSWSLPVSMKGARVRKKANPDANMKPPMNAVTAFNSYWNMGYLVGLLSSDLSSDSSSDLEQNRKWKGSFIHFTHWEMWLESDSETQSVHNESEIESFSFCGYNPFFRSFSGTDHWEQETMRTIPVPRISWRYNHQWERIRKEHQFVRRSASPHREVWHWRLRISITFERGWLHQWHRMKTLQLCIPQREGHRLMRRWRETYTSMCRLQFRIWTIQIRVG